MPQYPEINKLCRRSYTPTGRQAHWAEDRHSHSTPPATSLPPRAPRRCSFLTARLGRRRPRPSPGDLGFSSEPLLGPSRRDSLAPGGPAPPPPIGVARPAPPGSPPGARIPVQRSRRPPSVRALLPAASVHPRLTSTPASRLLPLLLPPPPRCSSRSPGGSESASEGGRRRVSPPLCSSPPLAPLRSPPLRSAAAAHRPRPSLASRPSRPAQGSHSCQAPRYPGNRPGNHSRPLPAPSHARFLGVPPSQAPGPSRQRSPGVLAEAGGWGRRRGVCEETGPVRQAGPGDGTPTSGKRGREMRQTWGGCSGGAGWGSKKRETAVQETPLP